MNTFINVVFRKILYRIPLKFLLILLSVGAVLFASFSNAGFDNGTELEILTVSPVMHSYSNSDYDVLCITNVSCNINQIYLGFTQGTDAWTLKGVAQGSNHGEVCTFRNDIVYLTDGNSTCNLKVIGYNYVFTQNQCEFEYNLIPISSVDSNYCENNNLCPSYDCPTNTGDLQWSAVYVNNVQHIGGENIFIDIPDTVGWDYYNYNDNFYLSVSGSNFNYEVLDQVKSVQSYVPTTDDFSKIIGGFGPFGALLGAVILVVVVFYLIKKVF